MVGTGFPKPIRSRLGIVAESLLALSQRLLGPLAVRNIGIGSIPFDDLSRLVAQRRRTAQEPAIFSICAPDAFDVLVRGSGFHRRAPPLYDPNALVWMDHCLPFGTL